MTTEEQRQLLDLQFLQGVLQDQEISTRLTEKSDQLELSFLSAQLPATGKLKESYLQLMYIPTAEMLDETNLLQFFAYLSEELPPNEEMIPELLQFLNTRTPLGYFATGEDGRLFYRYIFTVPRFTVPNQASFWETFNLFSNTFTVFGTTLLELANGEIDLETAKSKIAG